MTSFPRFSKLSLFFITISLLWACQKKDKNSPFTSFDGVKIAFTDEGTGNPVFLLHGFINTRKNWDKARLKKDLVAQGYRVIAPDMRGNGDSDKPHDSAAYEDNAEIKDLLALADYLDFDEYQVVGYSRGAIILAALLVKDKRITKAVIGGMGAAFTDPNWEIPTLFAKAFSGEEPLTDSTKGAVEYAKSVNADLVAMSLLQANQPTTTTDQLAEIDTKILLLKGDKDDSNGSAIELQEYLPNSRLQVIPGDHNNTYKSQGFSDAVIAFFKNENKIND